MKISAKGEWLFRKDTNAGQFRGKFPTADDYNTTKRDRWVSGKMSLCFEGNVNARIDRSDLMF